MDRRVFLTGLAGAATLVAGCQSEPVASQPPSGVCDRAAVERLFGMDRISDAQAMKLTGATIVRQIGPGQGVTSMFSFGQSYGFIMGVLRALGISYQLVPPAVWKREFGLLRADKQASIETCKQLFPGVSLLPGEQCRKDSDGMAEALLIALYAQRKF